MKEYDIRRIINQDEWMMNILKTVKALNLPDWWIGAGFVRSKVWDSLHGYKTRTDLPDVDVIYFDPADFNIDEINSESTKSEKKYEVELKKVFIKVNWSVTNQARMHVFHNHKPYKSSEEALSHWIETATCIGVRLNSEEKIELCAPHGMDDLVKLVLRPTNISKKTMRDFQKRIEKKQWLKKWPMLKIAE